MTSAEPQCVVVMGVSGSGKTTVARGLATSLGWRFVEGDDLHPADNVARMRQGVPLTDRERLPWLEALRDAIGDLHRSGVDSVVACSALRRSYRELLGADRPWVRFCHVTIPTEVIAERLAHRQGHFMPVSLLASQLATLEPLGTDEPGVVVDGSGSVDEVVDAALTALGLPQVRR